MTESRPWVPPSKYACKADIDAPLAERMRPRSMAEWLGHDDVLGEGQPLRKAILNGKPPSMLLWGPPGCGKTTLARATATHANAFVVQLSAVTSGVADLRRAVQEAERRAGMQRTLLLVDELHRYNKGQQDALLPHVENGLFLLFGATTENPSFAINNALLSRCRVVRFDALSAATIFQLLERALQDSERGLGALRLETNPGDLRWLATMVDGDARRALNALEFAAQSVSSDEKRRIEQATLESALSDTVLRHDTDGDGHYDVTSAFIKSMRGSDPDAALYWMMRLLEGGDDPRFVVRRMLIFASEDIGNADPQALQLACNTSAALERLGMPEALHALAQCCCYLASTVKSNASYKAWVEAQKTVRQKGSLEVPKHLRNAPTAFLRREGHGSGYRYPHDEGGYASGQEYLPAELRDACFYEPSDAGVEARLKQRLLSLRMKNKE